MIAESLPKMMTELPGPKTMELMEKKEQYVSNGVSTAFKLSVDEAKGSLIKDKDGNVFLDFAAGIGVQNIGHCNKKIVEAIQKQAEKLIHSCFHVGVYDGYVNYAQKITQKLPITGEKKVMLANSGAEAVENAVKIAKRYTGKSGVITLEYAFHGRTLMTMSMTSKVKPYKDGFGPFAPGLSKIPTGYCYRCPLSHPSCGLHCVEKFRTMLKGEMSRDDIAVVVVEAIQGEGGFIVQPEGYLNALQEICKENDIVFVIDEVQSGFARTGTLFACEQFGVDPDLITMSKSIAAGLPLSAVGGRKQIMDSVYPGQIGGTYGGNPIACEAALTVLEIIEDEKLCEKAVMIGDTIKGYLGELQTHYEVIGDIRGLGAMVGVEFVKDKETKEPYPELVTALIDYAYSRGVLFLNAGLFKNVLRFLPPLVTTKDQVLYAMHVIRDFLASYLV